MAGPLGPRRRIVGEELICPEGEKFAELFDVLACGHRQRGKYGDDGLPNAEERCCRGCRDGLPKGPAGEVNPNFTVSWPS